MIDNNSQKEWRERFRSVAKAQGRYLWLLLIAGVFYLALDTTISQQSPPSQQKLPLIGIEVDSKVVWASGSLVLGFIALAALGTFPALTYAYSKANPDGKEQPFESLDTEPTAIDFIVYVQPNSSPWTRLVLVTYPLFITLVVAESVYIWFRLAASKPCLFRDWLFLVLGGAFTLACFYRLSKLWKSKISQILKR